MASDGDLFQTRRVLGFHKAYRVAVQGGSVEEEAAAVVAAMARALRGEYRIGAFGKMVTVVLRTLAEHKEGLFFTADPLVCEQMISIQLDVLERQYGEQLSTHDTRRIIEALARENLATGAVIDASDFHEQCKVRLGRWLVDRLHLKPTETLARKALHLDRAAMLARQDAVFELCASPLGQWLDAAQTTATGRLPTMATSSPSAVDINSPAGLEEALV